MVPEFENSWWMTILVIVENAQKTLIYQCFQRLMTPDLHQIYTKNA